MGHQQFAGRKNIRCVDDQIGNPTHVSDLAAGVVKVIEREQSGLFHIGGAEAVSRSEFALKAAEVFGLSASLIQKIKTRELLQTAQRPMVTSLTTLKAEKELDFHPMTLTQGLELLKRELLHLTLN